MTNLIILNFCYKFDSLFVNVDFLCHHFDIIVIHNCNIN